MKNIYFSAFLDGNYVIRGKASRLSSSHKYSISVLSDGRFTYLLGATLDDFISLATSHGYLLEFYSSPDDFASED